MVIGIPTEIMDNEYRSAITPGGVRELARHGHTVLVESGAGRGSSVEDEQFRQAGAKIVNSHREVFEKSSLILKVKEPLDSECELLLEGKVLMCFLHLATSKKLTTKLMKKGVVAIAYETVQLPNGNLPVLAPMSEVAGRMATQIGAHFLEKMNGGRGVLLGGVSGVAPGEVVVLGGGTVGTNAAWMAAGMEAHVTILDNNLDRLRYLDNVLFGRVVNLMSDSLTIEEQAEKADLLIGAVLIPGAKTPKLVTEAMVKKMKKRSVVVDISVDQGGSVETTRVTTHSDPIYEKYGVLHYAVANIPGSVPRTSTYALANVTVPYAIEIANKGYIRALSENSALAKGVNVIEGKVSSKPVAEAHGLEYCPLSSIIPIEFY
jgi:alanine dehydrogenase